MNRTVSLRPKGTQHKEHPDLPQAPYRSATDLSVYKQYNI